MAEKNIEGYQNQEGAVLNPETYNPIPVLKEKFAAMSEDQLRRVLNPKMANELPSSNCIGCNHPLRILSDGSKLCSDPDCQCLCDTEERKVASFKIATVVKREDGYHVLSEKGKNLGGPYASKEEAEKRLGQVEYFKHKGSTEKTAEVRSLTCESCGKTADVDDDGEWKVVTIEAYGDDIVPGQVTSEGWLIAGQGGASADMEYCPECSKGLPIKEQPGQEQSGGETTGFHGPKIEASVKLAKDPMFKSRLIWALVDLHGAYHGDWNLICKMLVARYPKYEKEIMHFLANVARNVESIHVLSSLKNKQGNTELLKLCQEIDKAVETAGHQDKKAAEIYLELVADKQMPNALEVGQELLAQFKQAANEKCAKCGATIGETIVAKGGKVYCSENCAFGKSADFLDETTAWLKGMWNSLTGALSAYDEATNALEEVLGQSEAAPALASVKTAEDMELQEAMKVVAEMARAGAELKQKVEQATAAYTERIAPLKGRAPVAEKRVIQGMEELKGKQRRFENVVMRVREALHRANPPSGKSFLAALRTAFAASSDIVVKVNELYEELTSQTGFTEEGDPVQNLEAIVDPADGPVKAEPTAEPAHPAAPAAKGAEGVA